MSVIWARWEENMKNMKYVCWWLEWALCSFDKTVKIYLDENFDDEIMEIINDWVHAFEFDPVSFLLIDVCWLLRELNHIKHSICTNARKNNFGQIHNLCFFSFRPPLGFHSVVKSDDTTICWSKSESQHTMTDTEDDSACSDSWPANEEWLIEMLKQHGNTQNNVKIADFSVKQGCADGANNLSDILSIVVVYNVSPSPNDPASSQVVSNSKKLEFIIKLLPHDPFSRYFVTEAKFDLREIKFYKKILPDLLEFQDKHIKKGCEKMSICVPKCFHR